jgi:hypothetical protein
MLYAHLDLITTEDPLALRGCINYIENQVRPEIESQPGSLGLSLLASPEYGVAVCESLWASRSELGASEQVAAPLRAEMARQARGSVTAARYQLPVFEQEAPLHGGEGARLTRIEVRRSAVTDVIEAFGDSAVPRLAGTLGFPLRAAVPRPELRPPGQPDHMVGPAGTGSKPERRRGDPGRSRRCS